MNMTACNNTPINIIIKYIESNLYLDLNSELLSRLGFVSHTQLYRDFYSVTGHSVKVYIRKRRLSNALALIKSSDIPLADIAYECGYSSQQALCRSVKQAVKMTPLEYKNTNEYYFFPPFDGHAVQAVAVSEETIPKTLCIKFYHCSLRNIENMAVDAFIKLVPEYDGRIFGRNGKQNGTKFCYKLYLTEADNIQSELNSSDFEVSDEKDSFTALFATSTVLNKGEKIIEAWNYLYSDWLQNSMFEYSDEEYFEEYLYRGGKPAKLRLYLPIRKRSDCTKITLLKNPQMRFLVSKAKGYMAEQIASKKVFDYLSEHYPYLANTSKKFYMQKGKSTCACGVKINSELIVPVDDNVQNILLPEGSYIVLQSNVIGDYNKYCNMLLAFSADNGMNADEKNLFAVYDASDSYTKPKIQVYCPVKIGMN